MLIRISLDFESGWRGEGSLELTPVAFISTLALSNKTAIDGLSATKNV